MKWYLAFLVIISSCSDGSNSEIKVIQGRYGDLARITIVNGIRNGQAHLHDRTGSFERSGMYRNGVKEGTWVFKKDGRIERSIEFKNGLFDGKINTYNTTGSIIHQLEMAEGKREGTEIYYYEDGDPRMIIEHHAGKREGKFERWSRTDTELKGDYETGAFCEDQKCGTWTKFFPNGEKRWAVDMQKGKRNGKMNFWNSKGETTEVRIYENGKLIEKRTIE